MLANVGKIKGYRYTETLQVQMFQFTVLLDIMMMWQGVMKMPFNLTAELKNLKQQTADIDHLKTQAENDLSTIQVL